MDEEATLTSQEVRHLVFFLLDAVDIAEGNMEIPTTWSIQAWELAMVLVERLYGEEGSD